MEAAAERRQPAAHRSTLAAARVLREPRAIAAETAFLAVAGERGTPGKGHSETGSSYPP